MSEPSPTNITLVEQMREPVRACLGDFNAQFQKYSDAAIDSVVRTCLMTGKVPGQGLDGARTGIAPGITTPKQLALLMYHAAKMFMGPRVADFSFHTRALSQRTGEQKLFWFDLNEAIYQLESGDMFASFQSFYSWVNAVSGVDVWAMMTDMKTNAPVATVTIGRDGMTVSG